jgi:hypothetical protein
VNIRSAVTVVAPRVSHTQSETQKVVWSTSDRLPDDGYGPVRWVCGRVDMGNRGGVVSSNRGEFDTHRG